MNATKPLVGGYYLNPAHCVAEFRLQDPGHGLKLKQYEVGRHWMDAWSHGFRLSPRLFPGKTNAGAAGVRYMYKSASEGRLNCEARLPVAEDAPVCILPCACRSKERIFHVLQSVERGDPLLAPSMNRSYWHAALQPWELHDALL